MALNPDQRVLFAACLCLPAWAGAEVDVAGVRYDDATDLRGARLQLN
ncbi:MAG: hypothetical protein JWP41_2190, partial [Ramlibacter sp.]|nr:hypothetical protein [Ramlibacter sp.]